MPNCTPTDPLSQEMLSAPYRIGLYSKKRQGQGQGKTRAKIELNLPPQKPGTRTGIQANKLKTAAAGQNGQSPFHDRSFCPFSNF